MGSENDAARFDDVLQPVLTPVSQVRELEVLLQHLVDGVQALLPETRGAAVLAGVGDDELCRVATDDAVAALLEAELRLGDGPSLESMVHHEPIWADLELLEHRWPSLAELAVAERVRGWHAVPLCVDQQCLGVLVHLSHHARPDDDELRIARTLGGAALLAVERAHHEHHTRRALESRSLIGSALGILMERYDLSAEAAFGYLRRLASSEERKLREVAADLVAERGAERGAHPGPREPA